MTDTNQNLDRALDTVDESRRKFLRKVVLTTAFTAPVVASFAIDGMSSTSKAQSGQLPDWPIIGNSS